MKSFTAGFKLAAAAMVIAAGAWVTPAGAVTATFYNNASTQDTHRFTLGCGSVTGDCAGQLEVLSTQTANYDATSLIGGLFDLPNQGAATELGFVNANTLGGTVFTTGTKVDGGGLGSTNFSTDAEYILIKIGTSPDNGLIHNLSGGTLHLFFEQTDGTGSGLSHFTQFGTATSVVPLPASVLLLLSGLGGLGLLGWRRRAALA